MKDEFTKYIPEIEKAVGYTFKDKSLLAQAFTRTSFCNEANRREKIKYQSNEVLEFFGDTVLSCAIITFLLNEHATRYERGVRTRLTEGDFSNIKSKLSDKKNLSLAIKRLGLEKFLRVGEGDAKLGIMNEPSVMEDLFESIIGAIFIDSDKDMPSVAKAVSNMLDLSEYITTPPIQSAKNALQEWCDDKKRRLPHPRYETVVEHGPDHKKEYERAVYVGERLVATGKGKNLKLADAKAAENALAILSAEEKGKKAKKGTPQKANNSLHSGEKTQHANPPTAQKSGKRSPKAEKGAREEKKKPTPEKMPPVLAEDDSSAALRAYAQSMKITSPRYRDLGLVKQDGKVQHRIACDFAGLTATALSDDRQSARAKAASLVKKQLKAATRAKKNR